MFLFSEKQPFEIPEIKNDRKKELLDFSKKIEVRFKSLPLLNLAFCHRSFANEKSKRYDSNERLEFLGDSVLGLVTASYLFNSLPEHSEGDLARIKSFVVSEPSLAEIAFSLGIDKLLLIGKGEECSGGRQKKALLADCVEAIIGACYLDSGFKTAQDFVLSIIVPQIDRVLENKHKKDYKTLLQETVQKKFKTYPRYNLVKKTGPDHDKTFWIEVEIKGKSFGPGEGKNKKSAEQEAARQAYEYYSDTNMR